MKPHLVCIGMGYSASALARRLGTAARRITGSATSAEGCERIVASGWHAAMFDGTAPSPALAAAIATATHIVVSAAPDAEGDPLLRCHDADLAAARSLGWIGYLSTVGVYGDHQGAWVDEDAPLKPVSLRSRQRVAAETAWRDFATRTSRPVQLFRLAGIYGPGRSAVDNLKAGTARRIIKQDQVFNRIHVDDIANVVAAAIARPDCRQTIFNVTDDEPAPPQDVVEYAAKLMGLAVPPDIPFASAPLSPMGLSFYGENKRVSNARMKRELGVTLLYPTYREGMTALVRQS